MTLLDKIKTVLRLRKPATDLVANVKEIKRGWKTLAFWVTLLGTLGSIVAALNGVLPAALALIITTALTTAYNILRGAQKADETGIRPSLTSTEFWIGILGHLSTGLLTLQTHGINPEWVMTASTIVTGGMVIARDLAHIDNTATGEGTTPVSTSPVTPAAS